jgi:short-subunit dehydrogenase
MYSTSKYGVLGLTETIRNELEGTTVGISALCPAGVRTRIFDSERNRPAALTQSTPPPPHTPSSSFDLSPALEPEVVAEIVVDGIRRNQLYIFTDLAVRALVERHHQRMMDDFDHLEAWQQAHSSAGTPTS